MLRNTYGMSYSIPHPETPTRSVDAQAILAERLEVALDEIEATTEEAADPGETVLGFFRRIVADADGQ